MSVGKIKWQKIGDTTWEVDDHRGYTAEIEYDPLAVSLPYEIVIDPGAVTSQHATLRQAKNVFRKFLFDKPLVL